MKKRERESKNNVDVDENFISKGTISEWIIGQWPEEGNMIIKNEFEVNGHKWEILCKSSLCYG